MEQKRCHADLSITHEDMKGDKEDFPNGFSVMKMLQPLCVTETKPQASLCISVHMDMATSYNLSSLCKHSEKKKNKCASEEQWGVKWCDWKAYTNSHEIKCHFSRATPTVMAPADTKQRQPHRPSPSSPAQFENIKRDWCKKREGLKGARQNTDEERQCGTPRAESSVWPQAYLPHTGQDE